MMRKGILVAAVGAVAVLGLAGAASATEVRFMTGPQAGFWVPLGGQLKDAWEKAIPDLKVQSLPGAGIANVRGIEEGKAEVGFANTITTADAVAGTGEAPLDKKHEKVCNVATLYPQYFQVVVNADSGINTIKDVKGKSFGTQVKGNTGELIARHVLRVSGLTYNDVKAGFTNSYTDSVEQMKDNRLQVFALGTGIPASSLMDLASARDIKLIDLSGLYEDMKKINPAYKLVTVPKGTYPKQDKDVQVIGYYTHVVASCALPEDTVHKMTAAIMASKDNMTAIYKDMGNMTPQVMAQDIGVKFHPGAAKWYKEQGITVK
jgi:TRAP transporter TAXI family solute receptor